MYFGFVEVKENEGGRPHYRHKQTTKSSILSKQKLAVSPKMAPLHVSRLLRLDIKEASVQRHTKDTRFHKHTGLN